MDIYLYLGTGLLVADSDDCLTILIGGILTHTEHQRRGIGGTSLCPCPGIPACGGGLGNPALTVIRDCHFVRDITLQIDGKGTTSHINIKGRLINLERGDKRLVDGNLHLNAGILIAYGNSGVSILIARIFLDFQGDSRGRSATGLRA